MQETLKQTSRLTPRRYLGNLMGCSLWRQHGVSAHLFLRRGRDRETMGQDKKFRDRVSHRQRQRPRSTTRHWKASS